MNSSRGLSLGGVSMFPLYRIEPQFGDSVDGSWGAGVFSGYNGVGVPSWSFWASFGGVNSVVTFFLRCGGFFMRMNCSVLVVAACSLNTLLEMVLLVLAAGFLSSSLEVIVLL